MEEAAWLGVSTDRLPAALRQHLKLKNRGIGLLVERVEPKSPAEAAGLQQYDILEKLNDQWLVNTEQFSVLIRMHQAGEEISLSVIREGQPQVLKATLVEKELPVLGMGQADWQAFPAGGVFNLANDGEMRFFVDQAPMAPLMQLERLRTNNNSISINDGEHTLRINTREGKRTLVASNADGVVVFDGPIDTEEQRAALPDEIAEKLQKFDDVPGVITVNVAPLPATVPSTPKF